MAKARNSDIFDKIFKTAVLLQNYDMRNKLAETKAIQADTNAMQREASYMLQRKEAQHQFQLDLKEDAFEAKKHIDLVIRIKEKDSFLGLAAFTVYDRTMPSGLLDHLENQLEQITDKKFIYDLKTTLESHRQDALNKSGAEFQVFLKAMDELTKQSTLAVQFDKLFAELNSKIMDTSNKSCEAPSGLHESAAIYGDCKKIASLLTNLVKAQISQDSVSLTEYFNQFNELIDRNKEFLGALSQLLMETRSKETEIDEAKKFIETKFMEPSQPGIIPAPEPPKQPVPPTALELQRPPLLNKFPFNKLTDIYENASIFLKVILWLFSAWSFGIFYYWFFIYAQYKKPEWKYKWKLAMHKKALLKYEQSLKSHEDVCKNIKNKYIMDLQIYDGNLTRQERLLKKELPLLKGELQKLLTEIEQSGQKAKDIFLPIKIKIDGLLDNISNNFILERKNISKKIGDVRYQLSDFNSKHNGIFEYIPLPECPEKAVVIETSNDAEAYW